MSVITFWSSEKKETAQSLSIAAVATQIAIEHNYKILILSTQNDDNTIENCFWEPNKENFKDLIANPNKVGIDSGIEGLLKTVASNRTSPEIVTNYTKIVFKDRLEILSGAKTKNEIEYQNIKSKYVDVIKIAKKYYDIILVDLNKGLDDFTREILENSDVVVVNLTQRLKSINDYAKLREKEALVQKRNVMILIGRYDKFSKYNSKNIAKFYRQKDEPTIIPYNTQFFEACSEGKIADLFLKIRTLTSADNKNVIFIDDVKKTCEKIIYKMQEAQMKI